MASFPNSVFAPVTRSNGQTIDAAHVNDLQDEIVAIEAGYRNGTAPLNSSGSTFALRPVMPPPDAALVGSTVVGLTLNTTLAIAWTHQIALTNSSIHSTSVTPERLTPQSTGIYAVACHVAFSGVFAASTGGARLRILDSSGIDIVRGTVSGGGGSFEPSVSVAGLKRFDSLSATPWVRAEIIVTDSSTQSLSTISAFSLQKL